LPAEMALPAQRQRPHLGEIKSRKNNNVIQKEEANATARWSTTSCGKKIGTGAESAKRGRDKTRPLSKGMEPESITYGATMTFSLCQTVRAQQRKFKKQTPTRSKARREEKRHWARGGRHWLDHERGWAETGKLERSLKKVAPGMHSSYSFSEGSLNSVLISAAEKKEKNALKICEGWGERRRLEDTTGTESRLILEQRGF